VSHHFWRFSNKSPNDDQHYQGKFHRQSQDDKEKEDGDDNDDTNIVNVGRCR
jgi:hypothetical protein